eukprot:6193367-Pleurochrysis_carterae.AAC.4
MIKVGAGTDTVPFQSYFSYPLGSHSLALWHSDYYDRLLMAAAILDMVVLLRLGSAVSPGQHQPSSGGWEVVDSSTQTMRSILIQASRLQL